MYRVILADDETILRENMSRRIPWGKYGFELAAGCRNGQEVLDFLKKEPVDLVISDICMPYMDGMQLCEILHRDYPEVKVILLSGYEEFEYAKKAITYGVVEYILKPVTSAEMGEHLKKVAAILDEERQKQKDSGRYEEAYRENYSRIVSGRLRDFILGEGDQEACAGELEQMGMELPVIGYRVAVIDSGLVSGMDRESSLIAFVIFNMTQQILKEQYAGCAGQGENNRTVILFEDDGSEENRKRICQICGQILDVIRTHTGIQAVISLGSYTKSRDRLGLSYCRAKESVLYRYLFGPGSILVWEDREEGCRKRQEAEKAPASSDRLADAVKQADRKKKTEVLEGLEAELRTFWYSPSGCRVCLCRAADRIGRVQESCREETDGSPRRSSRQVSDEILAAGTLAEAVKILEQYADECIRDNESRQQGSAGRYVSRALDFIEQNYTSPQIGIREVCRYLGLSPSYFSSLIKSETGETFVELLNRRRIEYAKELLERTSLRTYEVAEKAGFGDAHYFGTAFKKATGMTPGAYSRRSAAEASAGNADGQEEL